MTLRGSKRKKTEHRQLPLRLVRAPPPWGAIYLRLAEGAKDAPASPADLVDPVGLADLAG